MSIANIYMAKLRATYDANMQFFAEHVPNFHRQLQADGELPFHFVVGDNGEVTIHAGDQIHTESDLIAQAQRQMQHFRLPDTYPGMVVPPEIVSQTDTDIGSYIFDHYYENLHQFSKQVVLDILKQTAGDAPDFLAQPYFGPDAVPIAVVVGTGLGWHLPLLAATVRMKHLVLIDTDVNITKLSMFFVDYVRLFHQLEQQGTRLTLFAHRESSMLSGMVQLVLAEYWPPYMLNGIHFFYSIRHTAIASKFRDVLADDIYRRLFFGWGFFDDEMMSLRHGLANYLKRTPLCVTTANKVDEKVSAIVVGAGPSLDALIPQLRACKGKAVIISCGTALRALARAGIVPDFHVEVERTKLTYDALTQANADVLSQVRLIGISALHPSLYTVGAKQLMFLKKDDSAARLMNGRDYPVFDTAPTVVNAGTEFAANFGFKTVYLVGADCGFVDPERHHAQNTLYHDRESVDPTIMSIIDKGMDEVGYSELIVDVPGNFRELVSTNSILKVCKESLEVQFHRNPGVRFYNPNDGAKLAGAIPLPPEEFVVEGDEAQVRAAILRVESNFTSDYAVDLKDLFLPLFTELHALIARIAPLCSQAVSSRLDVLDILCGVYKVLDDEQVKTGRVRYLIGGSLLHLSRMIYDYTFLLRDEELALSFAREALKAIPWYLDRVDEVLAGLQPENLTPDLAARS